MRFLSFLVATALAHGAAPAPGDPTRADSEVIKAAERVAKNFLASIDAGNASGAEQHAYQRESRAEKSGRVTRTPAVSAHSEIERRKIYGRLRLRTLRKTEVLGELSGFPPGRFVRFTYALKFDKRETEVSESLTIKADNPQRWSVVRFAHSQSPISSTENPVPPAR